MKTAWKGANRFFLNLLSPLFPGLAKGPANGAPENNKHIVSLVAFILCAGALSLILFAKTKPNLQRDNAFRMQSETQLSKILVPPASAKINEALSETSPSKQASLLRIDLLEHLDSSDAMEKEAPTARDIFRPADVPEPVFPEKREAEKIQQAADPATPIEPEIEVKLLGFLEKQMDSLQKELERYAVLSIDNEILVVKKGDVINDRFEIARIGADETEVLDRETGEVMNLLK